MSQVVQSVLDGTCEAVVLGGDAHVVPGQRVGARVGVEGGGLQPLGGDTQAERGGPAGLDDERRLERDAPVVAGPQGHRGARGELLERDRRAVPVVGEDDTVGRRCGRGGRTLEVAGLHGSDVETVTGDDESHGSVHRLRGP